MLPTPLTVRLLVRAFAGDTWGAVAAVGILVLLILARLQARNAAARAL